MRPDLFLPIFAYPKCILLILLIENPWVAGGPGGVLPEMGSTGMFCLKEVPLSP